MQAEHIPPVTLPTPQRGHRTSTPGAWTAAHDARWPQLAARLLSLKHACRRSVRIVDVDCGAGGLLLHAVAHARALGFLAIEGRGIDASPALIGRARVAAARLSDPAIGMTFEVGEMLAALREEQPFPADIVLWPSSAPAALYATAHCLLVEAAEFVVRSDEPSWRAAA